jgi:alpha-tubulin suppressor-like RCC1 family protein
MVRAVLGLAAVVAAVAVPMTAGAPAASALGPCPRPPFIDNHVGAMGWGYSADGEVGNGTIGANAVVHSPTQVTALTGLVRQVESGPFSFISGTSFAVTADGLVWGWGYNGFGELADGTATDRATPQLIPGLSCVVQVEESVLFALALRGDGTVWTWGAGSSPTPTQVPGLTDITQISAGNFTSLARRQDGTVWAWGQNQFGQIGDGTTTPRPNPVQVVGLDSVTQVTAGSVSNYAVRSDGTVYSWGTNIYGELGIGSTDESLRRTVPGPVPGLFGATQLSAGLDQELARMPDGTVRGWGRNESGELGDGNPADHHAPVTVPGVSGVTQVSTGGTFSLALRSDGTVLAWGTNSSNQLGNGATSAPRGPAPIPGFVNVRSVVAGPTHGLALHFTPPVNAPPPAPPPPSPTPRPSPTRGCPPPDGALPSTGPQPQFCVPGGG